MDGTGPVLEHVDILSSGGTTTAGTAVAGTRAGSGQLLAQLDPSVATTALASGTGVGVTAKTVVASKLAALGAAVGGVLGIGLAVVAIGGVSYLGYRLVKDAVGKAPPELEEEIDLPVA
jgi:hypothetical protein